MRTYDEAIKYFAERVFNQYMGGSYNPFQCINTSNIAFIYETSAETVEMDVMVEFKNRVEEYSNEL